MTRAIGAQTNLQGWGIVELSPANYDSACPPQTQPVAQPRSWCTQLVPTLFGHFEDFFMFNAGQGDGGMQLITVTVDTINTDPDSDPIDGAANLDVDVELWFRDLNQDGWREVTNAARNTTGLGATLAHRTGLLTGRGTYAVGVKSQGEYSDIGQYTVTVRGEDVYEVEPTFYLDLFWEFIRALLAETEQIRPGAGPGPILGLLARYNLVSSEYLRAKKAEARVQRLADDHQMGTVVNSLFAGEAWAALPHHVRHKIADRLRDTLTRVASGSEASAAPTGTKGGVTTTPPQSR